MLLWCSAIDQLTGLVDLGVIYFVMYLAVSLNFIFSVTLRVFDIIFVLREICAIIFLQIVLHLHVVVSFGFCSYFVFYFISCLFLFVP